jgi:hypothetical protein
MGNSIRPAGLSHSVGDIDHLRPFGGLRSHTAPEAQVNIEEEPNWRIFADELHGHDFNPMLSSPWSRDRP